MIEFIKDQGSIEVINSENSCLCIVKDFIGEITSISSSCTYLTFILFGSSSINSSIELSNHNKLDTIMIKGEGQLKVKSLRATTIEIYADTDSTQLFGNVIKLFGCKISNYADSNASEFISANGHIWVIDTILNIQNCTNGINSPYVLIDNSNCTVECSENAILSDNEITIEHCNVIDSSNKLFKTECLVFSENANTPKNFTYSIIKDTAGNIISIASRRKLYGYDVEDPCFDQSNTIISGEQIIPAQPATSYDKFKHSTHYTNVDLHRWMNKPGEQLKGRGTNYITDAVINDICNSFWSGKSAEWEAIPEETVNRICEVLLPPYVYDGHPHSCETIEPNIVTDIMNETYQWPKRNGYELDEVSGREYELGIYSLYSYRNTDLKFYESNNKISEERELP